MGVGLNQKQDIKKGMAHAMGLHLVFHEGPSTSSGNYTSIISVNKIWYLCNDTNVPVVYLDR